MEHFEPKRQGLAEQLQRTRLFRYLSEEQVHRVTASADFLRYDAEERIIEEHSVDDALYVVLRGTVSVRVREQEREVYICTLGSGEVFGEAGVFLNMKRTASVMANDEGASVMRIRRSAFMKAIEDNPKAGIKVLLTMIYSLMQKLREVNLELAFERREDASQESIDAMIEEMMPAETKDILE